MTQLSIVDPLEASSLACSLSKTSRYWRYV